MEACGSMPEYILNCSVITQVHTLFYLDFDFYRFLINVGENERNIGTRILLWYNIRQKSFIIAGWQQFLLSSLRYT